MYFGSVRFFKHLFITIFLLLVLIPTGLSVYFGTLLWKERAQNTAYAEGGFLPHNTWRFLPDENDRIEALLAASEGCYAYQEKYPDLYVEPARELVTAENTIYLTFDDGPSKRTNEVLDILKKKDVRATFFVVGEHTAEGEDAMRRAVAEGHTIGIHSHSHSYRDIYASVEAFLDDFYQEWNYVYETTGVRANIFRFPGGSVNAYNSRVYQEIIAEMLRRGFTYYDWNVASGDAATVSPGKAEILENVLTQSSGKNRAIVLMHDSSDKFSTVAALEEMIDALTEMGFSFDRITNSTLPVIMPYSDFHSRRS